jgi:hypothetical protein
MARTASLTTRRSIPSGHRLPMSIWAAPTPSPTLAPRPPAEQRRDQGLCRWPERRHGRFGRHGRADQGKLARATSAPRTLAASNADLALTDGASIAVDLSTGVGLLGHARGQRARLCGPDQRLGWQGRLFPRQPRLVHVSDVGCGLHVRGWNAHPHGECGQRHPLHRG